MKPTKSDNWSDITGGDSISDSEQWFYGLERRRDNNKENEVGPSQLVQSKNLHSTRKKSLYEDALGCFNIYKRQNEALEKCASEYPRLRVFAFEHSVYHPGQRRFLVATVERFWHWYKNQKGVSFYELIQQNRPCRLYFDCEFNRDANPGGIDVEVVEGFEACVKEVFKEMYDITLETDKNFLILDSSTEKKFSEHIIVHLPHERLFPSNTSIKPFFESLEAVMRAKDCGLVWNRDRTKRIPLCDAAVYSMNRNFRLYLSTKLGKNNPLRLSGRCKFYKENKAVSHRQVFMDSLIIPALHSDVSLVNKVSDSVNDMKESKEIVLPELKKATYFQTATVDGRGLTSPYPVLEQHILTINRKWRENVSIRSWKICKCKDSSQRLIAYYLSGCRYCFNIGREHKSNGVYWIVDLCKLWCYQKCFDVDCRRYSSNYFSLPEFVAKSIPSIADVAVACSQKDRAFSEGESVEDLKSGFLNELVTGMKTANNSEIGKKLHELRRRSALMEVNVRNESDEGDDEFTDELLIKIALEDD